MKIYNFVNPYTFNIFNIIMNKIILIKDLVLEIINYCGDVNDWIRFMLSSKNIYLHIYPEFIFKRFKFMGFHEQTLPPCIRNNNMKYHYYPDIGNNSPSYISTNETLILKHCLFSCVTLRYTYGIFFKGLYLDEHGYPRINYDKILDLIDNNIYDNMHNKYIFGNYKLIPHNKHIESVSGYDVYKITLKFIKTIGSKYYQNNMMSAKTHYNKYIKMSITGCDFFHVNPLILSLSNHDFKVCDYCNEKYIDDKEQYHKNWKLNYHSIVWTKEAHKNYILEKEYKKNSFYHPINHKISKKIEM